MFYKDRGAGGMFAKLFNELAEMFPERKLTRLQDLILGKANFCNCTFLTFFFVSLCNITFLKTVHRLTSW